VALGSGLAEGGQAIQALGAIGARLYDAEQGAKADRAAAEAARRLSLAAEEVAAGEPDHNKWTQLYEERKGQVLGELGEPLAPAYRDRFQRSAEEVDFQIQSKLRGAVRERQMAAIDADTRDALSAFTDEEARASETEKPLWRQRRAEVAGRAKAAGVWTDAEMREHLQASEQQLAKTALIEGIRTDPVGTIRALEARSGPLSALSEPDRQVWISHAVEAHEAELREQHAARQRAQADYDRMMRLAGDEASRRLSDQAASSGVTVEEVTQFRSVLSPDEYRQWLGIAQGGGRIREPGGGGVNAAVYTDLYDRAARGEDVAEEAKAAFLSGAFGKTEHDGLRAMSATARYNDARTYLSEALRVGEAVQDPTARYRSATARSFFEDWIAAHPEASREEAQAKAQQLVEDALARTISPEDMPSMHLRPIYAVTAGKNEVDVDATAQATLDALDRGEIDEATLAEQLTILERIEAAQAAQRARRAPPQEMPR
jgi:hypothetical protein